jgi:hypothetical protein
MDAHVRYAVHHHWLDVFPWVGSDSFRLGEGGFYYDEITQSRDKPRAEYVRKFWDLASASERAFGLVGDDRARTPWTLPGCMWLLGAYDFLDPEIHPAHLPSDWEELPLAELQKICQSDPKQVELYHEERKLIGRRFVGHRKLPIGVFPASVRLIEAIRDGRFSVEGFRKRHHRQDDFLVTREDLSRLTGGLVQVKTIAGHMQKSETSPKPVDPKTGKAYKYRHSECVAWWPSQDFRVEIPQDANEARRILETDQVSS